MDTILRERSQMSEYILLVTFIRNLKIGNGTCLVVLWQRLHAPYAGSQGSVPGQGSRF